MQSLLEFWWWSPREPMCLEPMLEQHIAANWTNYIKFIYLFVKSTTTCTVSIRTPHLRLAVDLPIKSEAFPGFSKTRGMHFCNHVNIYSRCYLNCRVVSHVIYSLKLYGHGNGSVFRVSMGILVSIQSLFCRACIRSCPTSLRERHWTTEVMLGMILAPEHLERVIDRGPSAQQDAKLKRKGKAETESTKSLP